MPDLLKSLKFGEMFEVADAGSFNATSVSEEPIINKDKETKKESKLEVTTADLEDLINPNKVETEQTLETKQEPITSKEETKDKNLGIFQLLPEALKEDGVLEFSDEELKSLQESSKDESELFYNAFKIGLERKKQTELQEYVNSLEGDYKTYAEARIKGIEPDEFVGLNKLYTYHKSLTPEVLSQDIELRKSILKEYYTRTTQMSEQAIDNIVDTEVKIEKDKINAPIYLSDLVKLDEYGMIQMQNDAILKQQERDKSIKERHTKLKSTVESLVDKEILPGIKIKKDECQKLLSMQTDIVDKSERLNAIGVYRKKIGAETFDIVLAKLIKEGIFENKANKKIEDVASSKSKKNLMELLNSGELKFNNSGVIPKKTSSSSNGSIFKINRTGS